MLISPDSALAADAGGIKRLRQPQAGRADVLSQGIRHNSSD